MITKISNLSFYNNHEFLEYLIPFPSESEDMKSFVLKDNQVETN